MSTNSIRFYGGMKMGLTMSMCQKDKLRKIIENALHKEKCDEELQKILNSGINLNNSISLLKSVAIKTYPLKIILQCSYSTSDTPLFSFKSILSVSGTSNTSVSFW
jgi:hypothetical protein